MLESPFNKSAALKACAFIKKEISAQVFSYEYCEVFINRFLLEHFLCSLYFSEILRDDGILWTSLGEKVTFFIFLVLLLSFIILMLESRVHVYFVLVFIPKFLHAFQRQLQPYSDWIAKNQKQIQNLAASSSNLLWKMWIWVFWILSTIEWSNYFNVNSRLHSSNKLKESRKFFWTRLWNLCFITMKESIFSKVAGCKPVTWLNWSSL